MSLREKCEGGEEVKVKLSEKGGSAGNIEIYDGKQRGREKERTTQRGSQG